jgi:hypothetical protein
MVTESKNVALAALKMAMMRRREKKCLNRIFL